VEWNPVAVARFVARSSRRIAVSVVGGAFVVGGLALLVLPGPGVLVVAVGFAILGTEYAWAAMALDRTRRVATQVGHQARARARGISRVRGRSGASGT
jgi:hypothetical protein